MDSLTLPLFAPGMTVAHRTGLGGLAATLWMWQENPTETYPGDDAIEINPDEIVLRSKDFRKLFKDLYEYAFQLHNGLIYLPGANGPTPPRPEVLVLQTRAICGTILQHNRGCPTVKRIVSKTNEDGKVEEVKENVFEKIEVGDDFIHFVNPSNPNGEEQETACLYYKPLEKFKHQGLDTQLFDRKGFRTIVESFPITIAPGFPNFYKIGSAEVSQPLALGIAMHFLIVGSVWYGVHKKAWIVYSDVEDLTAFAATRYQLTWSPGITKAKDFYPSSAAEAATKVKIATGVSFTQGWAFRKSLVSKHQAQRTAPVIVRRRDLKLAEVVLNDDFFPTAFIKRKAKTAEQIAAEAAKAPKKKKKPKDEGEPSDNFWAKSRDLKPLLLRNATAEDGRPWLQGFHRFCQNKKVFDSTYTWEWKGLSAMITVSPETDQIFTATVHSLMRAFYARKITVPYGQLYWDKVKKQCESWRVTFVNCKSSLAFETAFAKFCSRAGTTRDLVANQQMIQQFVSDPDQWEHARNLMLLAFVTYRSRNAGVNGVVDEDAAWEAARVVFTGSDIAALRSVASDRTQWSALRSSLAKKIVELAPLEAIQELDIQDTDEDDSDDAE